MKSSRFVAVCAITAALVFVLSLIPQSWGIPFLGLLPVLVVVCAFRNLKLSIFAALCAGFTSWVFSYIRPTLVSEFFQTNLLLPIVPRLMAVLLAHCCSVFVYKVSKKNIWCASLSCAIVGSVANTVFVLSSLYMFVPVVSQNNATFWVYFVAVVPTAAIELLLNSVLTLGLSKPVYVAVAKNSQKLNASKQSIYLDNDFKKNV